MPCFPITWEVIISKIDDKGPASVRKWKKWQIWFMVNSILSHFDLSQCVFSFVNSILIYQIQVLNISYKDRVTNEEVRNRIQNVNGVHDDLLTMVKKRKLRWYDHISRSSGMAKTILQGTVKGTRRRDRRRDDKIASRNGQEWGVWRFPVGREW